MGLFNSKKKVYKTDGSFTSSNNIDIKYTIETEDKKELEKYVEWFESNYISGEFRLDINRILTILSEYATIQEACAYVENRRVMIKITFDTGHTLIESFNELKISSYFELSNYSVMYGRFKETPEGYQMKVDDKWHIIGECELRKRFDYILSTLRSSDNMVLIYHALADFIRSGINVSVSTIEPSTNKPTDDNHKIYITLSTDSVSECYPINIERYIDIRVTDINRRIVKKIIESTCDITPIEVNGATIYIDLDNDICLEYLDNRMKHFPSHVLKLYYSKEVSNINDIINTIKFVHDNIDDVLKVMKLYSINGIKVECIENGKYKLVWKNKHYSIYEISDIIDEINELLKIYENEISKFKRTISDIKTSCNISDLVSFNITDTTPALFKIGCHDIPIDNICHVSLIHDIIKTFLQTVTCHIENLKKITKLGYKIELYVDYFPILKLKIVSDKSDINTIFDPESSETILEYINMKHKVLSKPKYTIEQVCGNCRFMDKYFAADKDLTAITKHSCQKTDKTVSEDSYCVLFSASDRVIDNVIKNMISDAVNSDEGDE